MLESSLTHWHCFHQTMKQTEDQHSTNTIENGTSLISNSIDFHLNFIHSIPIIRVLPERHVFPHFQNSHDRENNLVHVITILETILSFPKLCKLYVFYLSTAQNGEVSFECCQRHSYVYEMKFISITSIP